MGQISSVQYKSDHSGGLVLLFTCLAKMLVLWGNSLAEL